MKTHIKARLGARALLNATTLSALMLASSCTPTVSAEPGTSNPTQDPVTATAPEGEEASTPPVQTDPAASTETGTGPGDEDGEASGHGGAEPGAAGGPVLEVPAPADLPAGMVAEPVWSIAGTLVGAVGEVAVFQGQGDSAYALRAVDAAGSVVWEVTLEPPAEIATMADAEVHVRRGVDGILAIWVADGDPTSGTWGRAAVSILEPSTGAQRGSGFIALEDGSGVHLENAVSLDELELQRQGGYATLRIDTDTGELSVVTDEGAFAGIAVTSDVGVAVSEDGSTDFLQVRTPDGPLGDGRACQPAQPWPSLQALSANGRFAFVGAAVVDLTTGEVTCVDVAVGHVPAGVSDDGALVTYADDWDGAQAEGLLEDLLLMPSEGGFSAHRLR